MDIKSELKALIEKYGIKQVAIGFCGVTDEMFKDALHGEQTQENMDRTSMNISLEDLRDELRRWN